MLYWLTKRQKMEEKYQFMEYNVTSVIVRCISEIMFEFLLIRLFIMEHLNLPLGDAH